MKAATPPPPFPNPSLTLVKGVSWVCVVNFGQLLTVSSTVHDFFDCCPNLTTHCLRLFSKVSLPASLTIDPCDATVSPPLLFQHGANPLRLQNVSCYPATSGGNRVLGGPRSERSFGLINNQLLHPVGVLITRLGPRRSHRANE
jgi:hypothetical protein